MDELNRKTVEEFKQAEKNKIIVFLNKDKIRNGEKARRLIKMCYTAKFRHVF
jgi:hypothetical protein